MVCILVPWANDPGPPGLDMTPGEADNPAHMTTSPSSISGANSRRFFGFVYFGA
jgi:hypothetical protein